MNDLPPRVPASVGALIFDSSGCLLLLKTTYKRGWSLPGGQMEADGESPWAACKRETVEECGLLIERGELVCVDFLPPTSTRAGGLRFLFDCGRLDERSLTTLTLQPDEIEEYRLAPPREAVRLLTGPVGRRVGATLDAGRCVYLEDGRRVSSVN